MSPSVLGIDVIVGGGVRYKASRRGEVRHDLAPRRVKWMNLKVYRLA